MIVCKITSPKQTVTYKDIQSITFPALSGQIQILPGHAEAFILLQEGDVILQRSDKKSEVVQITSGECHVKDNVATVIL